MTLGWQEIFLVMIFALVIFGPKRLPEIGRQIGRAIREVRKISGDFEREIRSVTGDWEREVRDVTGEVKGVTRQLEREVRGTYALDDDHSTYLVPPKPAAGAGGQPASQQGDTPAQDGAADERTSEPPDASAT